MSKKAKFGGFCGYDEIESECGPGGSMSGYTLSKYRVRSMWIGHGLFSFFGSILTGLLTTNPITHWWVEIEAKNDGESYWFIAQLNGRLELISCRSRDEIEQLGKLAGDAGRYEDKEISTKWTMQYPNGCTMEDVYNWVTSYPMPYHLISNNCQDFGTAFYHRF